MRPDVVEIGTASDPRHFAINPTGAWLLMADQHSDTTVAFRRDPESGALVATGQVTQSPSPVAIVFVDG